MALITNTLDNGSNGQQTTLASLAASGSQPTYLIVNNASAPSGGSAMLYSNELAAKGVPMTVKVNGGITQNTYLRWDNGDTNGTRFVARRMLYLTANPGSTATILNMRGGSPVQFLGQLHVTAAGRVQVTNGVAVISGSQSAILSLNTVYYVEMAITPGSPGLIEYQIAQFVDSSTETVIATWSSGPVTTNNNHPVYWYDFGAVAAGLGQWDWLGTIQAGPLASGWLGPLATVNPTAHPGPHQAVASGATVHLDGSASEDTNSYQWSFLWPSSDAPTLTGATTATPSFTAGSLGSVYTLQLEATNGANTDTATVNVAVVEAPSSSDLVWTGAAWE